MPKRFLFLVSLIAVLSITTTAQELTAREYAKAHGISNRQTAVTLSTPHACTLSKQHPCIYYGGDIDPNDPEEDGFSNENTLFIEDDWTYNEIAVPVPVKISAAFTNNLQTFGIIDPPTANWQFRIGVSEGNAGTLIAYGSGPALLTDTGRNAFGLEEYELVTKTPVTLPAGNVWFDVEPNCTNQGDGRCNELLQCLNTNDYRCFVDPRYFESDTDGLNGINSKFTVTSNTGLGPVLFSPFDGFFQSWCNDMGICGDGTSSGLLK